LPPSRHLADELGLSRRTLVVAYERLAAEGYARAQTGSSTFVATDLADAAPAQAGLPKAMAIRLSARGAVIVATPLSATGQVPGDGLLAAGGPALELFLAAAWLSATARVLRSLAPDLAAYPDLQRRTAL
jgi:GntR family transcriptional regulator/MocR family aminotransferase